jgi:phosphoribosyl 1,2-cyclic phosphodiesterase
MHLRFWGTRGSLPKPGPTTLRYGGNTPCVEVRTAGGTLIVLDCGSGGQGLGQALLAEASGPRHGHLLITHTHWDHIQGFPFLPRCSCRLCLGYLWSGRPGRTSEEPSPGRWVRLFRSPWDSSGPRCATMTSSRHVHPG